jgi:toxin ParE1/3/4
MHLRVSHAAREDMRNIHRHGEETFGLRQADAYAAGMVRAFRLIADYPLAARARAELPMEIRVQPYRSHVIIYAVRDTHIDLLRVRHALEDWIGDPAIDGTEEGPA